MLEMMVVLMMMMMTTTMMMMMMMLARTMTMTMRVMTDDRTIGTRSNIRMWKVSPHVKQPDAFGYGHVQLVLAAAVSSLHCRFSGALFL